MSNYQSKYKFALLSHVLPPSPSGQAVMLYRILKNIPHASFILLSRESYVTQNVKNNSQNATKKLASKYYVAGEISSFPFRVLIWLRSKIIKNIISFYKRTSDMESILQKERPEVLIVCSGDILDLPASYILSKKMHIPLICYMFDDYSHQWTGLKGMLAKLLASFILSSAKKILVPNEFLKKSYLRRYHRNAIIIHNPSSRRDLTLLDKKKKMLSLNTKNIIYTGSIYHAHLDAFYNLACALQLITDFDIRLHIYSSQSEKELRKLGIINNKVIYHNHVSEQSASIVQRQADILFLPLAFDSPIPEIIRTSSPGKLGEYLAAGKPILAHVPKDSFVSWYITTYQCGVVVNDNNPYTLSKSIHQLMIDRLLQKKIERNAGERAEKDFSIAQATNKFINVINSV